jgi:hypothetical protein
MSSILPSHYTIWAILASCVDAGMLPANYVLIFIALLGFMVEVFISLYVTVLIGLVAAVNQRIADSFNGLYFNC